jgi:hypothetical protein
METLMFLRKLKTIEIQNIISKTHVVYSYKKLNDVDVVLTSKSDEKTQENFYKVITTTLYKPKKLEEETRPNQIETKLLLAFPMNEYHESLSKNQMVFAYLPIREFGFKFLIQADFVLTSSREDIHHSKDWNKWIRDSIVNGFLESLEYFKADEALQKSWYSYIPLPGSLDKFFNNQVGIIQQKLRFYSFLTF